ncbi:MAG: PDZ domain-containing protein [Cytophagales bacterium]|nr:PDZ domain-containing protein [Cytophagales bacterium]
MKKFVGLFLLFGMIQSFAQIKKITSIPFELFGDHMFIKVSVDDSEPLDFIFDTGSGLTVIDRNVAESLELVKREAQMNKARSRFELIKHNKIEIKHFLMEANINVYATDLRHLEMSLGRDFDGIFGYDLLHHHTVHIDYDNLTMDIYDHGNGPKNGQAIPFKLSTYIPTIPGKVILNNGEPHEGRFFVMTGAGGTLDFNSPYAKEWDVIHKTGKHYSYFVKGLSENETEHFEGHVISFEFGDQVVEDLPIGISTATSGIQADKKVAGIIGNRILREFNITIDVPDKMMWIEKNSHFGEKLNINSAGIDVALDKDLRRFIIHQVIENSPASEAGIKVDSELLKVNGKEMKEYALPDVRKIFRRSGESVDLVISEDGAERAVTLQLISLIE